MRDLNLLPDLELALIQSELDWHDPVANRSRFAPLLEQARGADLVILPEMFSTGFSMHSAELAEPEEGPTTAWLREQAMALGAVVTGSLIIQAADGSYRNRLLWARPDGTLAHYDKRHLFRMAGEHKHYAAGDEQVLLDVKGWQVRPLICYDLRFPVWSRDPHNTDLLLYTANWPGARRHHCCKPPWGQAGRDGLAGRGCHHSRSPPACRRAKSWPRRSPWAPPAAAS